MGQLVRTILHIFAEFGSPVTMCLVLLGAVTMGFMTAAVLVGMERFLDRTLGRGYRKWRQEKRRRDSQTIFVSYNEPINWLRRD